MFILVPLIWLLFLGFYTHYILFFFQYTNVRPCEGGIGRLCCVDPNKKPEPIATCALHHLCVPKEQCYNGEINTSGAGLIDQRISPPTVISKCLIV